MLAKLYCSCELPSYIVMLQQNCSIYFKSKKSQIFQYSRFQMNFMSVPKTQLKSIIPKNVSE